jgi:alkyldihydroxyacetonephosphate synthase
VTQLYETGAAIYVYFGFNYSNLPADKVVMIYETVENDCRDEIMKVGGSISHHHGVGKLRKRFMKRTLPPMALDLMQSVKTSLDPKNVFAINNTIYRLEGEEEADLKGEH